MHGVIAALFAVWCLVGAVAVWSKVLAFCVLEESHSVVRPRQFPDLISASWTAASDAWVVLETRDLLDLWKVLDSLPDPVDRCLRVLDDATTAANVVDEDFSALAHVDLCSLPAF